MGQSYKGNTLRVEALGICTNKGVPCKEATPSILCFTCWLLVRPRLRDCFETFKLIQSAVRGSNQRILVYAWELRSDACHFSHYFTMAAFKDKKRAVSIDSASTKEMGVLLQGTEMWSSYARNLGVRR